MLLPVGVRAQVPGAARASAKLAPPLQQPAPAAPRGAYRVQVDDPAAFRRWAQQHLPGARVQTVPGQPRLLAVEGAVTPVALTACPQVQFVDVADRRARPEKEIDGVDLGANRIWSVHSQYPTLQGQGLTVSVKEEPFDPADLDFRGRVVSSPLLASPATDHATIMATLIGGGGNSSPTGRGVAPQVRLATSSYANLLPDDPAQLTANGVSVQNHSYGVAAVENYYGLEARAYDQQTRQYPQLLHIFSSGNQGNRTSPSGTYAPVTGVANLTGQFKQSKNTLTVGATDALGRVAPLSSRGPAYDGRLKPELVALGEAGTSDASAVVSGMAALVQQAYRDQHGALPPSALVKAALINSADDLGRSGPDFESGYGQTDALGAVQTVLDSRVLLGSASTGATRSFPLTVPAGLRQLKLTLVWTDPEAAANAGQALVNDLDLELVAPDGQRWRPWVLSAAPRLDSLTLPARRGLDRRNNVEQISLTAPPAGAYQVLVRGYQLAVGSSQDFAVAYELETAGLDWTNPAGPDAALRADELLRLRWQWRGPAATGRLEYRLGSTGPWTLISPSVDLAAGIYAWTPPDTGAVAQVRLTVGATAYPSAPFALNRPPRLQVGYYCPAQDAQPAEALLTWPAVTGATQYQVYQLGATRLELLTTTADTTLALTGAQLATRHYAVAPLLAGGPAGVRSRTLDYTAAGTACYVQSFQPRQFVTSQVQFDLVLGTTYQLRRIALERETAAGFQTVQTLPAGRQTQLLLTDQLPAPGLYLYRARLETTSGRTVYTATEAVQYARPDEVLLFPNPATAGSETVTLLDAAQRALRWELYDHLGRLVRQTSTDPAALNDIDIRNLRPGTYILRIHPEGGAALTRRLVVVR